VRASAAGDARHRAYSIQLTPVPTTEDHCDLSACAELYERLSYGKHVLRRRGQFGLPLSRSNKSNKFVLGRFPI
jgi:hypothetical protein